MGTTESQMAESALSKPSLIRRVMVVGSTGQGKSSLINLLVGRDTAAVSGGARGCTFDCKSYGVNYCGHDYYLTDTAGLNESDQGLVSHKEAIKKLVNFVKINKDGFNLLVFVSKDVRLTKTFDDTHKLFYQVIFSSEIPCILYLSGREMESDMDGWYSNNRSLFDRYNFTTVVCGTTWKETNNEFETLIAPKRIQTYVKMWEAIHQSALPRPVPMKAEINIWKQAFNIISYVFVKDGAFFKSPTKIGLLQQLRHMNIDEEIIKDVMKLLQ